MGEMTMATTPKAKKKVKAPDTITKKDLSAWLKQSEKFQHEVRTLLAECKRKKTTKVSLRPSLKSAMLSMIVGKACVYCGD
jgi:hypothetical protein